MTPGEHLCIRALLGIIAAIHDVASNRAFLPRTLHAIRETLEVFEKVRVRGGARFDLDGRKFFVLLDKQIDFRSTGFPIVKQTRLQTAVRAGFVDFGDDPAFKDGAA